MKRSIENEVQKRTGAIKNQLQEILLDVGERAMCPWKRSKLPILYILPKESKAREAFRIGIVSKSIWEEKLETFNWMAEKMS